MSEEPRTMLEPEHPTARTRAMNKLVFVALAVVAVCIGVFLYWSLQSTVVLKVNNNPFPNRVVHDEAMKNEIVILTVDYCKYYNKSGHVRTSYVSSTKETFLPVSDEHLQVGCMKRDVPIIIPKDLEPDTYKIKFRVTYDINPLKTGIVNEFESQSFEVGDGQQVR